MGKNQVISVVLNLHKPFVRHPLSSHLASLSPMACETAQGAPPKEPPKVSPLAEDHAQEERWFFEAISETYLPLLEVFDRLDADHVPFKMALSLSPSLCHMLRDEYLQDRYLSYVDRQIEFGIMELERTMMEPELHRLALLFYNDSVEKRVFFTERYEGNILGAFDYYQRKGRVELLTTAATHAFLPFYAGHPEAIQAQLETAIASHRALFGRNPQGFWLPELGWSPELDRYLRSYNFGYTILDTHSLATRDRGESRGSFYPIRTPAGVFALARDFYARRELEGAGGARYPCFLDPLYRDCQRDAGYELPPEALSPYLESSGARTQTGCKYWATGDGSGEKRVYEPRRARQRAREYAASFLDERLSRLSAAGEYMDESPISVCAYDGDLFGRFWHEGPAFIDALFRDGAGREGLRFMNPAEYLYKQDPASFRTAMPEFSSWGANGYGETWLDASNDWLYRHATQSLERMVELAERFPDDTGLKERALNQAAREILLAQCSDWPKMLYKQENAAYARNQLEAALRNFTTIYEALGGNYISTEWLTGLERRHNIFPAVNYRVFRRKR
jgi:1,4-alpha-glucan branching enzyme